MKFLLSLLFVGSVLGESACPNWQANCRECGPLVSVDRRSLLVKLWDPCTAEELHSAPITQDDGREVLALAGMARHPKTGEIHIVTRLLPPGPPEVVDSWVGVLNPITGVVTTNGEIIANGQHIAAAAIEFDIDGTLFAWVGNERNYTGLYEQHLLEVNIESMETTVLYNLTEFIFANEPVHLVGRSMTRVPGTNEIFFFYDRELKMAKMDMATVHSNPPTFTMVRDTELDNGRVQCSAFCPAAGAILIPDRGDATGDDGEARGVQYCVDDDTFRFPGFRIDPDVRGCAFLKV